MANIEPIPTSLPFISFHIEIHLKKKLLDLNTQYESWDQFKEIYYCINKSLFDPQ